MKVVVISDIHISGNTDPFYRALLSMIELEVAPGDRLVLAGDIFDFLVGKQPKLNEQYREFFELIRRKGSGGAEVTFIEGNHDFHLDTTFAGLPHFHLEKNEVEIATGSHRIYIAHGDLVDRKDYGYRALRLFFRSAFIRFTAFALPERAVEWIGTHSSKTSQNFNYGSRSEKGIERLEKTRQIYREFSERKFRDGFDAIVLGHCHDDHGFDFVDGQRKGRYLNVGFPKTHRSYIVFSDESGLERRPLKV